MVEKGLEFNNTVFDVCLNEKKNKIGHCDNLLLWARKLRTNPVHI